MGSGRGELSGLKVVLAILVAQLELREAQLLEQLLVPLQSMLLLQVVRAAVARALVDRGVGTLFPAVEGAVAVRTPVRSVSGAMRGRELGQAATDFAKQLAGLAAIVEVEEMARRTAMNTVTARRRGACALSPHGSQGSAMPLLIAVTQLLPVQGGLGRRSPRGLSQRGLGIDVKITVVRMLLAKIVAGMDLGFVPGEDLLQLLDEVLQVLASKFPAEPKHQTCYLAHGGESLGNLAGSLQGDFGKRDSTAFCFFSQARFRSRALRPKPPRSTAASPEAGGETRNASFPRRSNRLSL
jgi:hypothetical protein